jgi:hypothetical protein
MAALFTAAAGCLPALRVVFGAAFSLTALFAAAFAGGLLDFVAAAFAAGRASAFAAGLAAGFALLFAGALAAAFAAGLAAGLVATLVAGLVATLVAALAATLPATFTSFAGALTGAPAFARADGATPFAATGTDFLVIGYSTT